MPILKNSSRVFVFKLGSSITVFGAIALFSKWVGGDIVGGFFVFEALLSMFVILADLGIKEAAEKRLSEGNYQAEILGAALVLKTVTVSVFSIVVLVFSDMMMSYLEIEDIRLIILALFVMDFYQFGLKVLRGQQKIILASAINLLKHLLWVIVSSVLILFDLRLPLITGYISALFIVNIVLLGTVKLTPAYPAKERYLSLFTYAKDAFVAYLGGFSYQWVDVLILGLFVPNYAIAAYEAAWRVTEGILLIPRSMASSAFPEISALNERDELYSVDTILAKMIFLSLVITVPTFLGAVIVGKSLLSIVFRPEFSLAATVLVIFSFQAIIQSLHHIFTRSLQGIKLQSVVAISSVVSVVLNAIMNIVLIPQHGIIGAAVSTTFSYTVGTLIVWLRFRMEFKNYFPKQIVLWVLSSSLIMILYTYFISRIVDLMSVIGLLLVIISSAIFYTTLLFRHKGTKRVIKQVWLEIA